MLMILFPKIFKNIQCYSDLSHASSGAGKQGKCSESCFLVFLQEIGSKRKGKRGKEEFLKGKCNQGWRDNP